MDLLRHDSATCTREPCGRCKPSAPPQPPPPVDQNLRETPPAPDQAVASIGLASHPPMRTQAKYLRELADLLEKDGEDARGLASALASRGWGASTMGDGRRGNVVLTGPESEAAKVWPTKGPGTRWFGADVVLAQLAADEDKARQRYRSFVEAIMSHASDEDRTVTGSGECRACARFCDPAKKPGNRLVKSMCPTCYRAWRRYELDGGAMIRQDWIAQRRESLTERDADNRPIRVHTPEADHDLDLSSEHIGDLIDAEVADTRETTPEQEGP